MEPIELITRSIHGALIEDREFKFASEKGSVTTYLNQGSFVGYINHPVFSGVGGRKVKVTVEFVL